MLKSLGHNMYSNLVSTFCYNGYKIHKCSILNRHQGFNIHKPIKSFVNMLLHTTLKQCFIIFSCINKSINTLNKCYSFRVILTVCLTTFYFILGLENILLVVATHNLYLCQRHTLTYLKFLLTPNPNFHGKRVQIQLLEMQLYKFYKQSICTFQHNPKN